MHNKEREEEILNVLRTQGGFVTVKALCDHLFTSESVTEGHPDKICDQISDAVLDAILKEDPQGRVACETAITTGQVLVMGEITTTACPDTGRPPFPTRKISRKNHKEQEKTPFPFDYSTFCRNFAHLTNLCTDRKCF